ncbi:MAG: hypothetical protein HYU77_16755 [Betaproteobacteria bacterium]|nr:hypothetical protein [Betaproteobacteria bacterium]
MIKFGFRIRTKSGLPVENLMIQARDQAEAEQKLRRMYHQCEVIECQVIDAAAGEASPDVEGFISLIGRQEGPKTK